MDEKDGIIKALKYANTKRQRIINDLVAENSEKSDRIAILQRHVRCLTEVIRKEQ